LPPLSEAIDFPNPRRSTIVAPPEAMEVRDRVENAIAFPLTKDAKVGFNALPVRKLGQAERLRREHGNERKRVLAIMYQFPPDHQVGAQSCVQICRYLPDHGWDPIVLTVQERYIENADPPMTEPFPGIVIRAGVLPHPISLYRWLKASFKSKAQVAHGASMEGLESPKTGVRRWLLSMLLIPDDFTGWIVPAVISGLRAVRAQKVDCLFSSGLWWTNHLVGLALAELTGLPWIAHFRDPWTQAQWLKPVSGLSIRIEKFLERQVLRKACAVVCVTEEHTAQLRQGNPDLPPGKFITIPNGYDGMEWEAVLHDKKEAHNDKFTITYAGSFYYKRSPYPLFPALRSLIDSGEIDRDHIQLQFISGGAYVAEGLPVMDVATKYGLADQVTLPDRLSRPEAFRRIAQSDLLLLSVDQSYQIPLKTYEYLRAGRPILALTSGGAIVDLLSETGGAWVVDPNDGAGIRAAVLEAYRGWCGGVDARTPNQDVVAGFDRRRLSGRIAEMFDHSIAGELRA
jgi:hypothetical protein